MSMERNVKRLAVALAISLSLNLFLVGFGVARRMRMREGRERPAFMLGPHGFLRRAGLQADDPKLRQILEQRRGKLRAGRHDVMNARDAVRAALEAEPFDASKLDAALGQLRARTGEVQSEMHVTFLELAKVLGPAERRRLAAAPWLLDRNGPPPR